MMKQLYLLLILIMGLTGRDLCGQSLTGREYDDEPGVEYSLRQDVQCLLDQRPACLGPKATGPAFAVSNGNNSGRFQYDTRGLRLSIHDDLEDEVQGGAMGFLTGAPDCGQLIPKYSRLGYHNISCIPGTGFSSQYYSIDHDGIGPLYGWGLEIYYTDSLYLDKPNYDNGNRLVSLEARGERVIIGRNEIPVHENVPIMIGGMPIFINVYEPWQELARNELDLEGGNREVLAQKVIYRLSCNGTSIENVVDFGKNTRFKSDRMSELAHCSHPTASLEGVYMPGLDVRDALHVLGTYDSIDDTEAFLLYGNQLKETLEDSIASYSSTVPYLRRLIDTIADTSSIRTMRESYAVLMTRKIYDTLVDYRNAHNADYPGIPLKNWVNDQGGYLASQLVNHILGIRELPCEKSVDSGRPSVPALPGMPAPVVNEELCLKEQWEEISDMNDTTFNISGYVDRIEKLEQEVGQTAIAANSPILTELVDGYRTALVNARQRAVNFQDAARQYVEAQVAAAVEALGLQASVDSANAQLGEEI